MWSPEDLEGNGNPFVGILLAVLIYFPVCWVAIAIRFCNVRSDWSVFYKRCTALVIFCAAIAPLIAVIALIPVAIANLLLSILLYWANGWEFFNTTGSRVFLVLGWLVVIGWFLSRVPESEFTKDT